MGGKVLYRNSPGQQTADASCPGLSTSGGGNIAQVIPPGGGLGFFWIGDRSEVARNIRLHRRHSTLFFHPGIPFFHSLARAAPDFRVHWLGGPSTLFYVCFSKLAGGINCIGLGLRWAVQGIRVPMAWNRTTHRHRLPVRAIPLHGYSRRMGK